MTTLNELYTAWSENSVLRGAVVTTEAEVVDGLERVTRVPTFEVYGDSKEEQIDGMSYERYWNEEGWGDTMLTSQLTREDGESCTPWMENEGGER